MTPTDALAVWINGFFALAVVSGLLAVAALVALARTSRSSGTRTVSSLPTLATDTGSSSTDRAA
jgi:hypothetical protein